MTIAAGLSTVRGVPEPPDETLAEEDAAVMPENEVAKKVFAPPEAVTAIAEVPFGTARQPVPPQLIDCALAVPVKLTFGNSACSKV